MDSIVRRILRGTWLHSKDDPLLAPDEEVLFIEAPPEGARPPMKDAALWRALAPHVPGLVFVSYAHLDGGLISGEATDGPLIRIERRRWPGQS